MKAKPDDRSRNPLRLIQNPADHKLQAGFKPKLERRNIEPFLAGMRAAAFHQAEGHGGNAERERDICIGRAGTERRTIASSGLYRIGASLYKRVERRLVHLAAAGSLTYQLRLKASLIAVFLRKQFVEAFAHVGEGFGVIRAIFYSISQLWAMVFTDVPPFIVPTLYVVFPS